MLESGADLVVCQHSHCVGSFEQYNGGTIVYGQGNFLFDRHDNEFWGTALLVKAILSDKPRIEFIPVKKNGLGVKLPDQSEGNDILEGFLNRSQQIMTPGFVEEQFGKYCLEYGQYYLATLAGFGKSLRRADKYLGRPLTRLVYSRKKMDIIRNHFECETHRELIIEYLRQLTKKK
jgi:poly-gamma-glutamate synthesis protein (capsule biosynthesis protein)